MNNPDNPRNQGRALQTAWFEYMQDEMGLEGVMPPERKKTTAKDRVEPEQWAFRKEVERHAAKAMRQAKALTFKARELLRGQKQLKQERAEFEKEKAEAKPALDLVKRALARQKDHKAVAVVAMFEEALQERPSGPPQRRKKRDRGIALGE